MPIPQRYEAPDAMRHFRSRLDALSESERLQRNRELELRRRAESLLQSGVTLIPSDHLQDNEFVVSRELYEAAKRTVIWSGPG